MSSHNHFCCGGGDSSLCPFEGIEASFNDYHGTEISLIHEADPYVLEINHCHIGRVGWRLNDGTSIYMGEGDVSCHSSVLCSESTMQFPLEEYQGITINIDFSILSDNIPPMLKDSGINLDVIRNKFCKSDVSTHFNASQDLEYIFAPLYHIPEELQMPYLQLKVQEFLLFLWRQDVKPISFGRYSSQSAEIANHVHDFLIAHPEKRYTIDELSSRFLINTSSLKEVFKAVYGKPIATYMKEYRILHAQKLLRHSNVTIAEIAQQVGYETQSKFTKAFKDITGQLPKDYRKL